MKTILLTGATGFLGSHLLESLLKAKYKVVILKRSTSDVWRIEHLLSKVVSYNVDQYDLELAFLEQKIDIVIHTACSYGRKGELISDVVETNLVYGLKLLDACLKFNTNTFFNTDTLLHKNLNIYTLSKKQFVEWLVQVSDKVQVVNLKLEHMFGPKDDAGKFVSWIVGQLKRKAPEIKLTSGEQKRDFIYIDDVVSAYMTTLGQCEKLPVFSEYDVGTGQSISVKVFVEKLKKAFESQFGSTQTKLNFGAIPLREGEVTRVDVNNSTLIELGWHPKMSLDEGLTILLRDYR